MKIILITVGVLILLYILMYNSLISRKNMVDNMFASIDALLQQRYDMIPNLVSITKEYMKYEKSILKEIVNLRNRAINSKNFDEKVDIENRLNKLLSSIIVNVENYPQLKANQNFLQLQEALKDLEDRISAARRAYNQATTDYNNAVEMFPTNLIASMFNFHKKRVFEVTEDIRSNIEIKNMFKE